MGQDGVLVKRSDIVDAEVQLTSKCSLSCPLCLAKLASADVSLQCMSLDLWKQVLSRYENLKSICIAGAYGEPTLFPQIIELVDFLKSRSVSIELHTNGTEHDKSWWRELSKHLSSSDAIVFTVCGSTQDIHGKCRGGQSLALLLKNAMAFKSSKKNDYVQHVLMQCNREDFFKCRREVMSMFSNLLCISVPAYIQLFNLRDDGVFTLAEHANVWHAVFKIAMRRRRDGIAKIECLSKASKSLFIDLAGNEHPCYLHMLLAKDEKFSLDDYSSIDSFLHDYCYECEKETRKMLDALKFERMV